MISRSELWILLNCTAPAKRAEHVGAIEDLLGRGYLLTVNDGDSIIGLAATNAGRNLLAGITAPAAIA